MKKQNKLVIGKFTDIAVNFQNLIATIVNDTPADCIVYILHHVEETDSGRIKIKTVGKMLDNQLTLEGLFTIVLMAKYSNKEYKFVTQTDGTTPCKSPMDMFELEIPNDLKMVDETIRKYYDMEEK